MPWTWFAVTVAGVAVLLVAEARDFRTAKWIAKPIASLGFLGAAVSAGALSRPYGSLMFLGLLFSFFGDVLLLPADRRAFLAGLVGFLLAHVAYSAAFLARGVAPARVIGALIPLTAFALVVGQWLLPRVKGPMRRPVVAYIVAICTMVALAAGGTVAPRGPLTLAAAVAFMVSDLSVARDRFIAPGFENRAWGLPLYYGAQLAFVASLSER